MTWEGLNRRKFPRANFPCLIKIIRSGEAEDVILTHTENVSIGGTCVIIKKSCELFTSVAVEIDLMDAGEPVRCQGKVVWSVRRKALEDNKPSFYDLGLEFVDIQPDDCVRLGKIIEQLVRSGHETGWK